jgi:hypothetical protein
MSFRRAQGRERRSAHSMSLDLRLYRANVAMVRYWTR